MLLQRFLVLAVISVKSSAAAFTTTAVWRKLSRAYWSGSDDVGDLLGQAGFCLLASNISAIPVS
jgi:hypothetical protein